MERRVAIQNLAFTIAGVVFLPGCNFTRDIEKDQLSFISSNQSKILEEIVEAIIPGDDIIPGGKMLKVDDYVLIMISDCHGKEVQQLFLHGLEMVEKCGKENYGKKFADLEQEEKIEILTTLSASEENSMNQFISLIKGLSIQGFITSEYFITNFSDYEMIPGPDYCCIEVTST